VNPALPSKSVLLVFALLIFHSAVSASTDIEGLFLQRTKSVVAVDYFRQNETGRHLITAGGVATDTFGTIILPRTAIDQRVSYQQLNGFKVYRAGDAVGTEASYLGRDKSTGWYLVRAPAKIASHLVPITYWASDPPRTPAIGDEIWGIGLSGRELDFAPRLLRSEIALFAAQPQRIAFSQGDLASPGLPVFSSTGALIGLAVGEFGQTYLMDARSDTTEFPVMFVNPKVSRAFALAADVLPHLPLATKDLSGLPVR